MQIIVKTKVVPSIGTMHSIALRHIFDRLSVTEEEKVILEEGIAAWSKKVDLFPDERWELKRIVNALIADEHGYFNRSKELQRQHEVDYRLMYKAGLPFIDSENRTTWNKS